jgi:hypothetical protein
MALRITSRLAVSQNGASESFLGRILGSVFPLSRAPHPDLASEFGGQTPESTRSQILWPRLRQIQSFVSVELRPRSD